MADLKNRFAELIDQIDQSVFTRLSDVAYRENGEMVLGIFRSPFMQPAMGNMPNAFNETHFLIRKNDVDGLNPTHVLRIHDQRYEIVDIQNQADQLIMLVLRAIEQ